MPARVLLAEEETLVREGLRLLLEGDFRVVGTVADAESLRAQTRRLRPDVVVAGLRLLLACPAGALSRAAPGVAFVVLLSESDDAGLGFFSSTSPLGAPILDGPRSPGGRSGRGRNAPTTVRGETKCQRDHPAADEVVRLLAHGKPMKEVAADLGISARTVAFHKYKKTMRALGLDSSAALVRYAVRNHML